MSLRALASDLAARPVQYDHFPGNFILYCPELRQKQTPRVLQCSSEEFFEQEDAIWFWNTFAKPVPGTQRVESFRVRAASSHKLATLERLPNELIEAIVDSCLDLQVVERENLGDSCSDDDSRDRDIAMDSVLALGLSSARLWPIVLAHIHRHYQRMLPKNWMGKKVVYHGRYSCFTNAQIDYYTGVSAEANNHRRFRHPRRNWKWSSSDGQPESAWTSRVDSSSTCCVHLSEHHRLNIKRDLSQAYLFPQDRVWVLRNLTTKQIVRSDCLTPPSSAIPEWDAPLKKNSTFKIAMQRLKGA